jgi:glycosyltransferase involved in cell wall biosynthesis
MQILQDVLLARGGAERVYWALEASRRFDRSIIGLSGVERSADLDHRQVLCELGEGEEVDPRQALRRVVESAHRYPKIVEPTLLLHHHAGLQFLCGRGMATLYLHTPTRFLWEPDRASWEVDVFNCRERDELRSRELDNVEDAHAVVTNSQYTARRLVAAYGRSPSVVHPPSELWKIRPVVPGGVDRPRHPYLITVSRLVSTKGLARLIEATRAIGIALVVVGTGRASGFLREAAGGHVHFAENCSDAGLRWLLRGSSAFVSFSREDFGIAVAEALCEGVPCVVPSESGVAECISDESGATFDGDGLTAFEVGVTAALSRGQASERIINAYRQHFSNQRFVKAVIDTMDR